jgi:hypothetical protein
MQVNFAGVKLSEPLFLNVIPRSLQLGTYYLYLHQAEDVIRIGPDIPSQAS